MSPGHLYHYFDSKEAIVEGIFEMRLQQEAEIVGELHKLKTAKLLNGFRGAPPVDINAVADAVAAIGRLMRATVMGW